mmetsp:Transcript_73280/g.107581  ORF Transcript_73280/g.107581 Transcript_73280/m.107581 type:complete len:192 (-) Transcript_73280:109-684(-)
MADEASSGLTDMEIATEGVFRLLEEQRRRLEMAIQVADGFTNSSATSAPKVASENEDELAVLVEQDEAELAAITKKVTDVKAELQAVRAQIAAKKGAGDAEKPAPKDIPPNPEAEKWLAENMSGIHASIAAQGAKLEAILAEADKCEKSVSRLAQLRTRRRNCKNKMPFQKIVLPDIEEALERSKAELAKL